MILTLQPAGSAVVASDGLVYSMVLAILVLVCFCLAISFKPTPFSYPCVLFQLLDYTQDNQPYWVVYDPKYPGSNTSVSMPEQDWACNWLLGIAQNPGSL
jgi:hypothetical protein